MTEENSEKRTVRKKEWKEEKRTVEKIGVEKRREQD